METINPYLPDETQTDTHQPEEVEVSVVDTEQAVTVEKLSLESLVQQLQVLKSQCQHPSRS